MSQAVARHINRQAQQCLLGGSEQFHLVCRKMYFDVTSETSRSAMLGKCLPEIEKTFKTLGCPLSRDEKGVQQSVSSIILRKILLHTITSFYAYSI